MRMKAKSPASTFNTISAFDNADTYQFHNLYFVLSSNDCHCFIDKMHALILQVITPLPSSLITILGKWEITAF